jgi:hypothetical protein
MSALTNTATQRHAFSSKEVRLLHSLFLRRVWLEASKGILCIKTQ